MLERVTFKHVLCCSVLPVDVFDRLGLSVWRSHVICYSVAHVMCDGLFKCVTLCMF